MIRLAFLALGLTLFAVLPTEAAPRSCEAVASDVAAARRAGDLPALARLWAEARATDTSCAEQALFCLGQSIALGHLEAGYAKGDAGAGPEAIEPVLATGLDFGSPWQLRTGLGDIRLARAKAAHDGALYSIAALDYQEALIALDQPPVCGAYGEPPRPSASEIASVYQRMTTALLLASPVKVATTKCAPCQWLFLAGVAGYTPASRPLPITFAANSSTPTPEGVEAAAALLDCLKGGKYAAIVLSGHTDETGGAAANRALSVRRLEAVRRLLVDGGYAGEIRLEPRGEEEPFALDTGVGFTLAEIRRVNRRIEFREGTAGSANAC